MSIGYKPKNAILDHFFMTFFFILNLTHKKQKIVKDPKIKDPGLYYLLVKIQIKACKGCGKIKTHNSFLIAWNINSPFFNPWNPNNFVFYIIHGGLDQTYPCRVNTFD